ncbi:GAF and ANTAR domain-containing protein [Curtobacterium aurantiacum]|uniref:GAF domain-containing protein n=1 Tax=Curtobacterium aurantiacum TaxID=3236919 RepID=A0ABS5VFR9_9MICO|nr:GAF and ANTAR domain-containing protein [Curtobacterium flaccumfaciens]MBT1544605.1 GAF domain-containing protein [Curtobacterium flaccumfaciens pv. flaccumfaciens]MBT1587570.1 GAF domain-containing protein [Curtobacterium flaccumfaciens pv. flaccumfaciens]
MTTTEAHRGEDRFERMSAGLHGVLEPQLEVLDAMDRVIAACVEFTSATEAGIVLGDPSGTLHVIASTSERTSDAEEAQLGTNEGSCLDCFRTGRTIDVPDVTTHESVWPAFAETMRQRGLRGTFAEPVRLRDGTIGSLCLFAEHTDGHDDADVVLIQLLADAASAALVRQRNGSQTRTFQEQIDDVIEARVLVEQAKGALAYRRGIQIDEAFQILRRAAHGAGRGMRAMAEDVVRHGADLGTTA